MEKSSIDDLEAIKIIVATLKGFTPADQARIIRWVVEKMSLSVVTAADAATNTPKTIQNIKSFVIEKNPQSDVTFAAAVAYYYRFAATGGEQKNEITSDDLQEACRLSGRKRLANPIKTLNNALRGGVVSKGSARGTFAISTVGENLVAISLPAKTSVLTAPVRAK